MAQMLVGPSKQLKQILQIEHNIVKNPNWPEANQLAIYKRGRGFELEATKKQIQVVARAGLEPRSAGLRVRHADHSATLPPYMVKRTELGTCSVTNGSVTKHKQTPLTIYLLNCFLSNADNLSNSKL